MQVMTAQFYKDKDVADMLQVAPSTVRSWVSEGRLSTVKFGRCLRFDPVYIESRLKVAKNGGSFLEAVNIGR